MVAPEPMVQHSAVVQPAVDTVVAPPMEAEVREPPADTLADPLTDALVDPLVTHEPIMREADGATPYPNPQDAFDAASSGPPSEIPFRSQMESLFGENFGSVRAFMGERSSLSRLGARAAAQGESVAFGETSPSLQLVGHELAHVVQARRAGGASLQAAGSVSVRGSAAEVEAESVGRLVAAGQPVEVRAAPSAAIQRNEDDDDLLEPQSDELDSDGDLDWFASLVRESRETHADARDKLDEYEAAKLAIHDEYGQWFSSAAEKGESEAFEQFQGDVDCVWNVVRDGEVPLDKIRGKFLTIESSREFIDQTFGKTLRSYRETVDISLKVIELETAQRQFQVCSDYHKEALSANVWVAAWSHTANSLLQQGRTRWGTVVQPERGGKQGDGTGAMDVAAGAKGLLKLLSRLLGLTTTHSTTSIKLGIKFTFGVKADLLLKAFEIGAEVFAGLAGFMNVQDDRRFRVGAKLALGASAKVTAFWRFFEAHAEIQRSWAITGVFDDVTHFSAFVFHRLNLMDTALGKLIRKKMGKKFTDRDSRKLRGGQSVEEEDGIDFQALGTKDPVRVMSQETSKKAGGSVLWGSISGEKESSTTTMNFYKEDESGHTVRRVATQSMKKKTFGISLGKFGEYKLESTHTEIRNHPNPDNNGDYENVKATAVGLPIGKTTVSVLADRLSAPGLVVTDPIRFGSEVVKENMASALKEPEPSDFSLKPVDFALEWNFVKTGPLGSFELQYVRASSTTSRKLEIPLMELKFSPFGPGLLDIGVSAGLEVTAERSWGFFEKMGTTTLTYLHTVYNGLMRRANGNKDWASYRGSHEDEILALILAVGTEGSVPHAEASGASIDGGLLSKTLTMCEGVATGVLEADLDESVTPAQSVRLTAQPAKLLPAFDLFLEAVRVATTAEGNLLAKVGDRGRVEDNTAGWKRVIGGKAKVYVDYAASEGLSVLLKSYSPTSQKGEELPPPFSVQEALYEEKAVEINLVGKYDGRFDLKSGGYKFEIKLKKNTDEDTASRAIRDVCMSKFGSPDGYPDDLLSKFEAPEGFLQTKSRWAMVPKKQRKTEQTEWDSTIRDPLAKLAEQVILARMDGIGGRRFKNKTGRVKSGIDYDREVL